MTKMKKTTNSRRMVTTMQQRRLLPGSLDTFALHKKEDGVSGTQTDRLLRPERQSLEQGHPLSPLRTPTTENAARLLFRSLCDRISRLLENPYICITFLDRYGETVVGWTVRLLQL